VATVVGQGSAAATSVAIPAHSVGDLILVFARGTAAAPSVPAAGGTVPAWATLQTGLANAIGLTVVAFNATATTTTTGVFTNATHIAVLVLRAGAGNQLQTSAARSAVGSGNNTQTIIYPALALTTLAGTSFGVRVGTRTIAATAVGTAPTSWTNQTIQPAGASALMSVHTRAALVANPVADTVTTTGTNAPYRAVTVEVQESAIITTVSVTGLGSAQAFGTRTIVPGRATVVVTGLASAQAFGTRTIVPGAISVTVGSVYPPGFVASITGAVITGDGHLVGGSTAAQFGTPVASLVTIRAVGSVPSAASFGTVTIRAVVTRAVGSVASAQAFGTPTIKTTVSSAAGSVPSAQAFGTVTIKTAITRTVGSVSSAQAFGTPSVSTAAVTIVVVTGLTSAQSFGAVTVKATFTRAVGAVSSAQAFGVPTLKTTVARAVGSVASAQAFGAVTIKTTVKVTVTGLGSAQLFGVTGAVVKPATIFVTVPGVPPSGVYQPTITGPHVTGSVYAIVGGTVSQFGHPFVYTRIFLQLVAGVPSAQAFGRPVAFPRVKVNPLGVPSAQAFGTPTIYKQFFARPTGVPSAQAFGTLAFKLGPVKVAVAGVRSAQAFGHPNVFIVYLRPSVCHDLDLAQDTETTLTLAASVCLPGSLTPSVPRPLTLAAASEEEIDLQPA
jgi:hypothetical protein